ncbi:hypothetical protein CFP65_1357 [Kitasatospora sp. MMS16-BH015]|uniref:chaplin n=1 Tax=Kitasatospora sp. MMS16-BH015 TaxID=2018025 RepID=UPI000CA127AB|nr:chaplin [Kitasatospora sp. MMS16-BH015]AUG76256.1 hypothetical protein CFP65_1357 [Kitasatospora sp. MMS16-BH015]
MRQVAKRGILTAVATGSVLASTAGYAYASTEAQGAAVNSPGVGSGNAVQAPVDIPVNACGNTVDVVGLLNPAFGNDCASSTRSMPGHHHAGHLPPPHHSSPMQPTRAGNADQWQPGQGHLHPGAASYGSSAAGVAHSSPGVASGNQVQAPVSIPVNACGNTVDVVGLANPAFGNDCGNAGPAPTHSTPPPSHPTTPPPPAGGDDCQPGGTHNPPPPGQTSPGTGGQPPVNQPPPPQGPPVQTPPVNTPPVQAPPAQTPPVQAPPAQTPVSDTPPAGTPGSDRNGGPTQATPVSSSTGGSKGTGETRTPRQGARSLDTAPARAQLASTGTNALGLELASTAGLALMIGGGVLYRRSRAGAR